MKPAGFDIRRLALSGSLTTSRKEEARRWRFAAPVCCAFMVAVLSWLLFWS